MDESTYFSAQTLDGRNPQRLHGVALLAVGIVSFVVAALYLADQVELLKSVIASEGKLAEREPLAVGGRAALAAIALLWVLAATRTAFGGLRRLGTLVVPPRMPRDFANWERDLGAALARREMPAYAIPPTGPMRLAYRLFPGRFSLMTPTTRLFVANMMRSSLRLAGLVALLVAIFGAVSVVPPKYLNELGGWIPNFPLHFVVPVVGIAALQIVMVIAILPSVTPVADTLEFRLSMRGGGDPKAIPHGLEHQLLVIRPESGAPNRQHRQGFEMLTGGVGDTGVFGGKLYIESQPTLSEAPTTWVSTALLAAGTVLALVGVFWVFEIPEFMGGNPRVSDTVQGLLGIRWAGHVAGGLVLYGLGRRLIASGASLLSVFRFESLAVLLDVEGNYGRSKVRVGKGVHDSIESENIIVRSDCSITGHVATLLSETVGIDGPRAVVGMATDERARDVEGLVQSWLGEFSERGVAVAGVDLADASLGNMVRANMQVAAQRTEAIAGAQHRVALAHAQPAANFLEHTADVGGPPDHAEASTTAPPIPESTPAPVSTPPTRPTANAAPPIAAPESPPPTSGNKACPDCAEDVKAAARKCRYCGYRFEEAV